MRYHQTKRVFSFSCEETVDVEINDDDITKVMIVINLKEHNRRGFSLGLLTEMVTSLTEPLANYTLFHSPEGLVITGAYR